MKNITWSPWFLVLIAVALLLSVVAIITPGPMGPQGVSGPVGIQGLPGPPGLDGRHGIDGERGIQGPQGVQGQGGLQGVQGPQGIPGEIGMSGEPGEIVRESQHLASMAVSDSTPYRDQEIEVWGVDFHHDPELRLYDSDGEWFILGTAHVEWHRFVKLIDIPDDAALGLAELVTMTEDKRATYHTIPIMIRD